MAGWFHPIIDVESRPFWDGCAEGKLMIMRCTACDKAYFYPRAHCPTCWSDKVEWIEASGRGTLHSYSIVHQYPAEPFQSRLPYANIIVQLEEGPRLMSNWAFDASLDDMKMDGPVKVSFFKVDDDLTMPVFGPAD